MVMNEAVLVKMPHKLAQAIDKQVDAGCFTTRADFLRNAAREELYRQHSKQSLITGELE